MTQVYNYLFFDTMIDLVMVESEVVMIMVFDVMNEEGVTIVMVGMAMVPRERLLGLEAVGVVESGGG